MWHHEDKSQCNPVLSISLSLMSYIVSYIVSYLCLMPLCVILASQMIQWWTAPRLSVSDVHRLTLMLLNIHCQNVNMSDSVYSMVIKLGYIEECFALKDAVALSLHDTFNHCQFVWEFYQTCCENNFPVFFLVRI